MCVCVCVCVVRNKTPTQWAIVGERVGPLRCRTIASPIGFYYRHLFMAETVEYGCWFVVVLVFFLKIRGFGGRWVNIRGDPVCFCGN